MAKIPVRGMNPALKKVTEKFAKKSQVDDAIKNVRRIMSETAESAKPIQQVIDDTVGISVKRKTNGRRDIKSAKDSANVFMKTENKIMLDANSEIADRYDLIAKNRKRSQELKNKYNQKANNLEEAMKNGEINQIRQQLKNNSQDLSDRGSRIFEREQIKSSPNRIKERMEQAKANSNNVQTKTEKANSNASAKNTDIKGNGNNFIYKMAAAGVGGGIVLSMSNRKGQQSNSQLYGQGGY